MSECPRCESQNVTAGHLSVDGRSVLVALAFVPGEARPQALSGEGGTEVREAVYACADCGLVWSSVTYPENLRARAGKPA